MAIFGLSLWENYRWGLICFGQFMDMFRTVWVFEAYAYGIFDKTKAVVEIEMILYWNVSKRKKKKKKKNQCYCNVSHHAPVVW